MMKNEHAEECFCMWCLPWLSECFACGWCAASNIPCEETGDARHRDEPTAAQLRYYNER